MASRSMTDLHPILQSLCQRFLEGCASAGLEILITQTYRSSEEQNVDYASGRTTPGHITTDAKGGRSPHNCCLPDGTPAACAFDFALYAPGGKSLDWNASDDDWQTAIQIGKNLGLTSGSNFHGIADSDHMELPGWNVTPCPLSPPVVLVIPAPDTPAVTSLEALSEPSDSAA